MDFVSAAKHVVHEVLDDAQHEAKHNLEEAGDIVEKILDPHDQPKHQSVKLKMPIKKKMPEKKIFSEALDAAVDAGVNAVLHKEKAPAEAGLSPVDVLQQVKHNRTRLLRNCRTSMLVEMKRAQEERELMQTKVQEITGLKSHLMMAKIEEIIDQVVAPERERAIAETDVVTRGTLCDATLPSQAHDLETKLTEEEEQMVIQLAGGFKQEAIDGTSTIMSIREAAIAAEVNQGASQAVEWATERQNAAIERNLLNQRRMHIPVSRAVNKAEMTRTAGERATGVIVTDSIQSHLVSTDTASPRGKGPLTQPNTWNVNAQDSHGMQAVVRDAVIGKVAAQVGRGAPVLLQVFANDIPEEVAADFCTTYDKYSSDTKDKMTNAVKQSIRLSEQFTEEKQEGALYNDDAWVSVSEIVQVEVDLRRCY